jgi:hypothetical protein
MKVKNLDLEKEKKTAIALQCERTVTVLQHGNCAELCAKQELIYDD